LFTRPSKLDIYQLIPEDWIIAVISADEPHRPVNVNSNLGKSQNGFSKPYMDSPSNDQGNLLLRCFSLYYFYFWVWWYSMREL